MKELLLLVIGMVEIKAVDLLQIMWMKSKMKKPEFQDMKVIDNKEYVSRNELEEAYELKPSTKIFKKVDGKLEYIQGSWKRLFRINWSSMLVVLVIILSFLMIRSYIDVYNNPCDYCIISGCNPTYDLNIPDKGTPAKIDAQDVYVKVDINPYDNIGQ